MSLDDELSRTKGIEQSLAAKLSRARAQARLFGGRAPAVVVGRFELLEPLGAGGMGTVYAARDRELDREVALKFLHARVGVSPSELRRLLRREAQALAAISHPNVVEVHTIEEVDEHVFVAMERVRGRTLRAWLKEARPEPEQIVEAFAAMADALDAAHRAGIVHGDFKPENVIVADDGRARILDFGLANQVSRIVALSRGEDEDAGDTTSTGGTIAYAAPEQLAGAPRDDFSDQFAFFVTLHEALTGELPQQSAASEGRGEPAELPSSLRRLIARGLSRSPDDRWPSMASVRDRLRRRSHRGVRVAAVFVIGGLAAAGLAVSLPSSPTCTTPTLVADWDEAARGGIRDAFVATGVPGAEDAFVRARSGLEHWASTWDREARLLCDLPSEEREPRRVCLESGRRAFASLVDTLQAADASTLQRVDDALRELPPPRECSHPPGEPLSPEVQDALAEARVLQAAGRYTDAIEVLTSVGPRVDALGGAARVRHRYRLGELLTEDGRYDAAADALTKAYHEAIELGDDARAGAAAAYLVAVVGERQGKHAEGLEWGRHAEAALGRVPPDPDVLAPLHNNLGGVHYRLGDFEEALRHFELAAELWTELYGDDAVEVATALDNIGAVHGELAQPEAALEAIGRALAIHERHGGPDHPDVAISLHNRANILEKMGRYDEARPQLERALAIRIAAFGEDNPFVAQSLSSLGGLSSIATDYDAAVEYYERAADIIARTLPDDHPSAADPIISLGNIAFHRDQPELARRHYLRGLARLEAAYGEGHPNTAKVLSNIAATYGVQGRLEESGEYYERVLAISEDTLGADHPDVAVTLKGLGTVRRLEGKPSEAVVLLERALEILQSHERPAYQVGDAQSTLAQALWDEGEDRDRALELAEAARASFRESGPRAEGDLAELDAWLTEIGQ